MIICRKSAKSELSKATEQQPIIMQTTSSMVVASVPHLAVGTGLTDCSTAVARHSAQWVLQYVESLKNVEAEREGNKSSCTTLGNLFFADVLIFILAALTP
jgi:hypothetical protein